MHRVPIKDLRQYAKAIEVFSRVGGTYQGVGEDEWFLLVTERQCQALVDARVVVHGNGRKEPGDGASTQELA